MLGFRRIGADVTVYRFARIIAPENIVLGSHIIIDDYVFIGAHRKLVLGNYVHIASQSSITGGGHVLIGDFSSVSSGARLISGPEDLAGGGLTNPTIPPDFRQPHRGRIIVEPHVLVGANAVVLPDVTIGEGAVVGAGAVVTRSLEPWGIYVGSPARRINTRPREALLASERRFFKEHGCPEIQYRCAGCLDEV